MTHKTVELPLVDLDDHRGSEALHRGLFETGFFLLADHVIPRALLDEVRACTTRFLTLPREEKEKYRGPLRGWAALGEESAAAGYAAAGEEGGADLCEKFSMGFPVSAALRASNPAYFNAPEAHVYFADNPFPDASTETAWGEYYGKMQKLCLRLIEAIRIELELPEGVWDEYTSIPTSLLRFLSYPDHSAGIRMAAHYDDTLLSVLHQSVPASGFAALQVQLPGETEWRSVAPSDEVFVVNVGEVLTFLTGGRVVATKHRVVGPPGESAKGTARTSLGHFFLPNWDSRLRPSIPRAADGSRTSFDEPSVQDPDGSVLYHKVQQRQINALTGKSTA